MSAIWYGDKSEFEKPKNLAKFNSNEFNQIQPNDVVKSEVNQILRGGIKNGIIEKCGRKYKVYWEHPYQTHFGKRSRSRSETPRQSGTNRFSNLIQEIESREPVKGPRQNVKERWNLKSNSTSDEHRPQKLTRNMKSAFRTMVFTKSRKNSSSLERRKRRRSQTL